MKCLIIAAGKGNRFGVSSKLLNSN